MSATSKGATPREPRQGIHLYPIVVLNRLESAVITYLRPIFNSNFISLRKFRRNDIYGYFRNVLAKQKD